jgi:hypothetical protein
MGGVEAGFLTRRSPVQKLQKTQQNPVVPHVNKFLGGMLKQDTCHTIKTYRRYHYTSPLYRSGKGGAKARPRTSATKRSALCPQTPSIIN